MAGDQISTPAPGEPGFTIGSFFLRLLFALTVVLLTFNPSGFSFFHWARDAFFASSLGPLHLLAGIALLIGWVLFVQATRQSLGLVGVLLVAGLFAVLVWMLFFYDVVNSSSSATLTWIVLIGVAVTLTVGMSWAHMRRRLSGQATVDEVGD
jgi:4-amino-4-deoxy-L-arabinose transferase-like glycosyltransferase